VIGGVSFTAESQLGRVKYTSEWRLGGVSYTAGYVFRSVRYTGETIATQMKPATALKGTILQKTDQRCTFSSYSRINMCLKYSEVASF